MLKSNTQIVYFLLYIHVYRKERKKRGKEMSPKLTDLIPVIRHLSTRRFFIKYSIPFVTKRGRGAFENLPANERRQFLRRELPVQSQISAAEFPRRVSRGLGDSPRQRASPKRILCVCMIELEETCSADAYLELFKIYFRIKSFSR